MCLAIPAQVLLIDTAAQTATVDLDGVRKTVSIALVPEAKVGDHVVVHVGYALAIVDPAEAERTLALFGELAAAQQR